ncbi:MAG: 50S ribosomal protein L25 [Actinomycetia bacterium]|nr:50S ribosomal protein L25 [Actinomycetes bacterium]
MTETTEIQAQARERIGKANRALARQGKLPAVVYGTDIGSIPIQVDRHEFEKIAAHEGVGAMLFKLKIDGHKPINVMVKDISRDPTYGTIQHVDFWAIKMSQSVTTLVPIDFVGVSAGEKAGGVLLHELREVHVEGLPAHLPEHIEVDVSDLEVGMSLHLRDIVPPEGVTIHGDPDTIVCSVTAPTKAVEEEVVSVETEPEVIGEKEQEE